MSMYPAAHCAIDTTQVRERGYVHTTSNVPVYCVLWSFYRKGPMVKTVYSYITFYDIQNKDVIFTFLRAFSWHACLVINWYCFI